MKTYTFTEVELDWFVQLSEAQQIRYTENLRKGKSPVYKNRQKV